MFPTIDPSSNAPADLASQSSVPAAGMFDLRRIEAPPPGWGLAIVPAVIAWAGSVAFIGRFRPNEIASGLGAIAPLFAIYWACVAVCGVGVAVTALRRQRRHAVLWAAVLGCLGGHAAFAALPVHEHINFRIPFENLRDGASFALHRLAYGVCVAGCAGAATVLAAWALGSRPRFHLGVGSWSVLGRDFTHRSRPESYRRSMFGFAIFAVVLWVVGQMGVELRPLRSGALWALVPAIVLAALANALVEEIIYRGVLQPAFVHAAGIARGLWIQGIMFGLLHWGMSVGVVAALPTSLAIGVGSVFWGKAVLETRGLSWVVLAHAMVDVAIMCAYFVPRS